MDPLIKSQTFYHNCKGVHFAALEFNGLASCCKTGWSSNRLPSNRNDHEQVSKRLFASAL